MLRVIKGRRFATRLQALAEDDRQICGSVLYFHKGSPDPAMLRADGPCSSIGPYCMEEMEGIVENLFNVIGPEVQVTHRSSRLDQEGGRGGGKRRIKEEKK